MSGESVRQMWILDVQDRFSAAHQLLDYPGDCRNLHGHTYGVKVSFVRDEGDLDALLMVWDIREARGLLRSVLSPLDHRGSLNDILKMRNPTCEALAGTIWRALMDKIRIQGLDVFPLRVTVSEGPGASATYYPMGAMTVPQEEEEDAYETNSDPADT